MIAFDSENKVFRLDTPNTSYCMGLADGKYLGQIFYGPRLLDTDLSYLLRLDEPPFTPAACPGEEAGFRNSFPMEFPAGATGNFHEACIDIETEDGQDGLELLYKSHCIFHGKKKPEGLPASFGEECDTLEIVLEDKALSVDVILSYSAFTDLDVIAKSVRVINNGVRTLKLKRLLSSSLMLDRGDLNVLTLNGAWARERHLQTLKLGYGSFVTESLRGEPGHEGQPFLALVTDNCTQTSGEVYAMHFVYSGNFLGKAEVDAGSRTQAVLGIHPGSFTWILDPGETFSAPEAIHTYSADGLMRMTHTLHDFYRKHLIRSPWLHKARPILINNWEATYFNFDSDKLLSIAKEASKLGIEMLVMDDGWFGRRNSDAGSLGDWKVNEEKIHGGLKSLVSKVNALGMKFGIWFEPEMVSPDSELYRRHPDWILHTKGHRPVMARNQYVLDLSRPETTDYLFDSLSDILSSADIAYLKWDMNRALADLGSDYLPPERQGEISHRHVLALYRLQERLLERFPGLLLENCSAGGARFDPGMLYYSPQIWASDDMDPVERLEINEGTALLYPLSAIGAHVCGCPNDITGRRTPFETRALTAMPGTFGYELDITRMDENERQQIPAQIALRKRLDSLIREGDYFRLASYRENRKYDCMEVVSKDKKDGFFLYVQVTAEVRQPSRRVRLLGLLENERYRITSADGVLSQEFSGGTLTNAGFLVKPLKGDCRAVLYEIHRV